MICPNLSNPQIRQDFQELQLAVGEDLAYFLWHKNNGYHLDKTFEGKDSKLFKDLTDLTGNRVDALKLKAKTFTQSFKDWFGKSQVIDENGEPLIVYHGTYRGDIEKFKGYFDEFDDLHSGYYFAKQKEYALANAKKSLDEDIVYPVFLTIEQPGNSDAIIHDESRRLFQNPNIDGIIGIDDMTDQEVFVVKYNRQIKSIFNQGTFDLINPNIYDNTDDLKKISVNNPKETILNNFDELFPEIAHYNPTQQAVFADLVEQGHIRIDC